jgi:hypothetical protein
MTKDGATLEGATASFSSNGAASLPHFFSLLVSRILSASSGDAIDRTWMQLVRKNPDVPGAAHISHDALQDPVPELMNGNDEPVIWLKRDAYLSGRFVHTETSRRHKQEIQLVQRTE